MYDSFVIVMSLDPKTGHSLGRRTMLAVSPTQDADCQPNSACFHVAITKTNFRVLMFCMQRDQRSWNSNERKVGQQDKSADLESH